MNSKKITILLCLLIVTAVFTAAVSGSVGAKPTKHKDIEEEKPISIHVIWKDNGYYVIVTGPEGLNVYLVIIDHKGEKNHYEMKYDDGEYSAWISREVAKNKNEIYIAIIDASENLLPDDKGVVQALYFQVINIDIKGKKDHLRLKTTTVIESRLLLETVYDDRGRTGDNEELQLKGITRHGVRKGAGPRSLLDLTHTIEFQIPTPDFNFNSFFDVFHELDFHPPEPGYDADSFFDVIYGMKSEDFAVDSFFDVFFEKSRKGTDFHVDSYIDVDEDGELEPIIPESFSDISIKTDFDLPYPGRLGRDFVADSSFDVSYEIDFSGNVNRRDDTLRMRGGMDSSLSGGVYHARKNTPLGLGSTRFRISDRTLGPVSVLNKAEGAVVERESFFDVFTELTLGLGPHEKGGDDNYVDSFFDVFSKMSFHPGRTWVGPDGRVKLDSFFDVFTKLSIDSEDWDLVAIDSNEWDITADNDWESPDVLTSSFFDVFTSFEPEMFAETLPDDYFMYYIDSFFDVFFELINTVPLEEIPVLQLDDTEPPEVIFTTPVRGSYVTGTAAALRGKATDLGGGIETIKFDSFTDASLELGGSVDGSTNENYDVSFDGSIKLKNDIEKQFGESVSIGLASGASLNASVEKNSFKGAELTGVVITASVKVSDVEFELEGRVDGSINENYEVYFDGSIELKNDVEKEFGTIANAGIAAGARLEINDSVTHYSEKTTFKGEVTYIENPLEEEDKPRIIIRAYDRLHRLTRGTHSRTWSDREENGTKNNSNTILESRFDCFAETLPDDIRYSCIYSTQNPEPSTGSLFDAFVTSVLDINFPSVATGPISPPPENFVTIDSFFDVFTEIDSGDDGLYHIDSFFDVFCELSVDGSGPGLYLDTFFDVFTEIDLGGEVEFVCAWNEAMHIPEGFEGGEFQVISLQLDADFAAPPSGNDNGDSDPPRPLYFGLDYLSETLDGLIQHMAMLQTFTYSGIEMQKNNTTIAGDQYQKEPLHIYSYGTINLSFKYNPQASGDPPAMTIPGFELFHRLTRGTRSRTWDDGTTSVSQEVIWTTSTVTHWGEEDDEDTTLVFTNSSLKVFSQTPHFTDSFFDVFFEIELEDSGEHHIDSFFDITYDMDDDTERECPECGASVGSDDESCPDCGSELPEGEDNPTDSFFDVFFDVSVEIESEKGQDEDDVSKGLSALNLESKTAVGEDEYYFLADDIRFPSGDLGDCWEFDSGETRSAFGITQRGFWLSSAVTIPHQPLPEQDDEVLVTFGHGDSNHPYDIDIRSLGKDLWVDFTPLNRSLFAEIHPSVLQISNSTGNYTLIHVFVDVYANETDESGNVEKVLLYTDIFKLNYSLIDVASPSGSSSVKEVMELVVEHAEYR